MTKVAKWFEDLYINKVIKDAIGEDKQQFNDLGRFAEIMRGKLKADFFRPIAYTPHDFDRHIKDVLKNISDLLAEHKDKFSIEELLALQYACILHDIDMAINAYQREIHGFNGLKILSHYAKEEIEKKIKDEYSNFTEIINALKGSSQIPGSVTKKILCSIQEMYTNVFQFYLEDKFDDDFSTSIAYIIFGHSDIKADGKVILNTLDKALYNDVKTYPGINDGPMKLRVLAAILRIADELDCSKLRKYGIARTAFPPEGQYYWDKLNLISVVDLKGSRVKLMVNCKEFTKKKTEKFIQLSELEDKLQQEFAVVNQCFEEEPINMHFNRHELIWEGAYQEIGREYKQYRNNLLKKREEKKNSVEAINIEQVKADIENEIEVKELFRECHRKISGESARNHLDCNRLLTRHQILDSISQAFINAIFTKDFENAPKTMAADDYILVGIANSGALIAAHVSYMTGIPMTYYIPEYKKRDFTKQETDVLSSPEILESKKVILVIGAFHTGISIQNAWDAIEVLTKDCNKDRKPVLDSILGIVNRSHDENKTLQAFIAEGVNVQFIIHGYYLELCQNKEDGRFCPYNEKCNIQDEEWLGSTFM